MDTLKSRLLGNYFVAGPFARFMYRSLHLQHQRALVGWWRTGICMLDNLLRRGIRPRVKLH